MTNTTKMWIPGTQSAIKALHEILKQDKSFDSIELTDGEPTEQVEALNIEYKKEDYHLEWGDNEENSTGLYLYYMAPTGEENEWSMIDVNSWHNASYEFLLETYEEPIYQLVNDIKTSISEWYNSKEED